jgi:hypothetical protein
MAPGNPSDDALRRMLTQAKTIAVVGMSKNPDKDAHRIPALLIEWGYRLLPINPTTDQILGLRCYKSLRDVREPIDIVDVFRPSEDVPPIVDDAIAVRAKAVWMQTGIAHERAAAKARAEGLDVVQDRCISVEHRRLVR